MRGAGATRRLSGAARANACRSSLPLECRYPFVSSCLHRPISRRRAKDWTGAAPRETIGLRLFPPRVCHALLAAASRSNNRLPQVLRFAAALSGSHGAIAPVLRSAQAAGMVPAAVLRRRKMAAIGYVNGSIDKGFVGQLKTLTIRAGIEVRTNRSKAGETQPDYRVYSDERRDRRGLDPRRGAFGQGICVADACRPRVRTAPALLQPRPRRRAGRRRQLCADLESGRLIAALERPRTGDGAGAFRCSDYQSGFRWAMARNL